MNYFLLVLLQLALIFLNAIFACAEIAVLSVNETKLEYMAKEGNKRARRLFKLTREPAKFLATIQVAITLSGFLGSAFAADNFAEPLADLAVRSFGITNAAAITAIESVSVIIITLILSYLTLIFGELVPKRLAMKKSEKIAMGISGTVNFISFLFKPIVWLLSASTNIVLRMLGIDPNEIEEQVSEDEIRMMVDAGTESGTIEHEEKELIQNVFEFNDITAGEIATHRTDVTFLYMRDDDDTWAETIHQSRHTLYPVCRDEIDDIAGILNAKEYFRLEDRTRDRVMAEAVHSAFFVTESIKADVLLRNMKKTRNSLAVVMDEYGVMVGIVTIHDLIEELVGEINVDDNSSEDEEEKPHVEKLDDNSYKVIGNMRLGELEEAIGIEISSDDYETFTGYVFDALGVIPEDGAQETFVELDCMNVCIKNVDAHQIEEAIITIKVTEDDEDLLD